MADELYKKIAAIEQPLIDKGEINWKWQAVGPCKTRKLSHEERMRITEKYKNLESPLAPGETLIGPRQFYPFDDDGNQDH